MKLNQLLQYAWIELGLQGQQRIVGWRAYIVYKTGV